jgi:hypothetical protein
MGIRAVKAAWRVQDGGRFCTERLATPDNPQVLAALIWTADPDRMVERIRRGYHAAAAASPTDVVARATRVHEGALGACCPRGPR